MTRFKSILAAGLCLKKKTTLHGIQYWEDRAQKYGRRSVLNISHSEEEFDSVTQKQKDILFPLLKKQLRGDEKVLLDFGCGPGRFTCDLASMINGKAIGVDPIKSLIKMAPRCNNVEYIVMNESVLPVPNQSMDAVWICLVLGGLKGETLRKSIDEIYRVLKNDGLLFLVENTSDIKNQEHWLYRKIEDYMEMFPFISLSHISDYIDLDDRVSVMVGRKKDKESFVSKWQDRIQSIDAKGQDYPPVFIVGCDRSGTTLLRLMLNKHSKIDIPDESDFVSYLSDKRKKYGDLNKDENLELLYRDLYSVNRYRAWRLDEKTVREKIFSSDRSFRTILRAPFELHMEQQGKKRWGDKTPQYTRHIPQINKIFPDALFINIIRDGRDVATSLKKVSWFSNNIIDIAYYWKKNVHLACASKKILGNRYLQITYEDLVTSPQETLQNICAFINESYEPSMMEYSETSKLDFNEMYRGDHKLLREKPTTTRIGVWRKELTERDIYIFELIAGEVLEKVGYKKHSIISVKLLSYLFLRIFWHRIIGSTHNILASIRLRLTFLNHHSL